MTPKNPIRPEEPDTFEESDDDPNYLVEEIEAGDGDE